MMEECGELVQACSKVLRHGITDQKYSQNLHEELGDVVAMTRLLQEHYDISDETLEVYVKILISVQSIMWTNTSIK